jgi:hypothetical protein
MPEFYHVRLVSRCGYLELCLYTPAVFVKCSLNERRTNVGGFALVYTQRLQLNSELRTNLGKQFETGSKLALCVEYTRIKAAESLGMQFFSPVGTVNLQIHKACNCSSCWECRAK